jgi:hypothetical protein
MTRLDSLSARAPPPLDLRQLLLIGVGLPTVVAAVTYLLMDRFIVGARSLPETTVGFGCFVLEVGFVGVIVGKAMPHPLLRWLLYGWMMVLVDLLVGSSAMIASGSYSLSRILPPTALVAAQIGLAIVWGTLGTARWYWRMPLTLSLGAGLLALWILLVEGGHGEMMTGILVVQAITLTLISLALRVRGYRLVQLNAEEGVSGPENGRFQFAVRDVLIWTTLLAVLLGLMRGADMLRWKFVSENPSLFFASIVAVLTAMVIIFALWASLGQGHWLLRYGLLVFILLVLGGGMAAVCKYLVLQIRASMNTRNYDWELHVWYNVGWWWIAWMFLSGGLLAASLLVFRAVGYRLVRRGKQVPRAAI